MKGDDTMALDCSAIKAAAEGYRADMVRFLRAMIALPSESCEEKAVIACIRAEMEKLGYDKVEVDGLGNVIGWMGEGGKIIAIDSHVDTVGIGNRENWTADPYEATRPTRSSTVAGPLTRRAVWPARSTA